MFRPNTRERLSVTIFEPTQDIKVQARLLWRDEVVAETEKYIFGRISYGSIVLMIFRKCVIITDHHHHRHNHHHHHHLIGL